MMNILTIPIRNARTRIARTVLLILVFSLGVASITALTRISGEVGESFERKLVSYGANILVTPKRDALSVSYGGVVLGDVSFANEGLDMHAVEQEIGRMRYRANIAALAPKLLHLGRTGEGVSVPIVGVDWEMELALKAYWEFSGDLPSDSHSLLAGSALGRSLGLNPGDDIELSGQSYKVSGLLLPTGSDDDNVLFVSLAEAQRMSGRPGQADFLEVAALCAGCPMEDIVEELALVLPTTEVRALRQVAESRMYAVHFAQNLAMVVSLVILGTACAMIGISMYSSVSERRREIGIMRAVGFSRASVFTAFVAEGAGIGLISGILGAASGHVLAGYILSVLHLSDHPMGADLLALAGTVCLVTFLAVAASAVPALKASRVEPAEALVSL